MDIVKNKLNIGEPIYVIHFISKNESGGKRTKTKRKRNRKILRTRRNRSKRIRH
jgi:hypothetical protein